MVQPGKDYWVTQPLVIGRSHIQILCGPDGKASNDCRVKGGSVQLHVTDEFSSSANIVALVQGLTFSQAYSTNVLVDTTSDLLFSSCVWFDNENIASLLILQEGDDKVKTTCYQCAFAVRSTKAM